ncbi:MAG: hypothetical protein WKG01_16430 [Kofleriaceae bacterium]
MSPRLLVLALSPLVATATARAQAPGEVAVDPGYAQPPPAVVVASPAVSPLAQRWAIGLSVGGMGIHPDDGEYDNNYDSSESSFRIAELAVRYRASRRIELELSLGGGREVVEGSDGSEDGELAMGSVTFAARYRFCPEQRWNWWLMAGLGGTVVAPHVSTEDERDAATRPHGTFGVGLERRFRRFAIQAELRGVAMGPSNGSDDYASPPDRPLPLPSPAPSPELTAGQATQSEELGGGAFTIGASYYF